MKTRIITGLVMAAVMIPIAFLTDTWVFPIFVALLSLLAVFEILKCVGALKNYIIAVPSLILGVAAPLLVRVLGVNKAIGYYFPLVAVYILVCASAFMFEEAKIPDEKRNGREHLSYVTASAFFSVYSMSGFTMLVMLRDSGQRSGLYLIISVFITSYLTDIMAYFTGMFFGKHKLIPKISPKKTIEGAVGGTVFATAGFVAFALIVKACDPSVTVASLPVLIAAGLFGSVVSQIGDLLMSALKRSYGIKDFGKIFPGHGGILDRFDSVLAVSVITFAFNSFIIIFRDAQVISCS